MKETGIKSVLVTGAAGGVGRTICRKLLEHGFKVKGLVRPEDSISDIELGRSNLFIGYVEDPQTIFEAMQGVDTVIHCAALLPNATHLGEKAFNRVNVEGALNVLRQADKLNVKRTVFFSTISVVDHMTRKITPAELQQYVGEHKDPYLMSKINLEKALTEASKNFKGQITILRPAFIYGPGNFAVWHEAIQLVQQGKMVLIGDGNVPLPLIYAEDIARFVLLLMDRPLDRTNFNIYILASPERTTMKQIFYFMADHLGVKHPLCVPLWPLSFAASILALLPEKLKFGRLKILTKARVMQYSKGYDLSGVINPPPLGFIADTNYQVGVAKMLDDYKNSMSTLKRL